MTDTDQNDGPGDGEPPSLDESVVVDVFDQAVGVGVVVLDADLNVTWVNGAFESFFGVDRDAVLGEDERTVVREHVAPATADPDRFADILLAATDENADAEQLTVHVTAGDGRDEHWLEHRSRPLDHGECAGGRVELYYDVTNLVEREREIERHRDELDRLARVNSVIRDVNRALVGATTRTAVEDAVVERLAAADTFSFAVVGEFTRGFEEFAHRAWSGLDEDTAETVLDEPDGLGPHADAVRSGEVQVTTLDDADAPGLRSVASVPLRYRSQVYGVLGVYAPDAFDDREVSVLGELGETVAHAINAIERRRALVGEQVVEVELRSRAAAGPFTGLADEPATIVVEHTIPLADDRFIQYVAVEGLEPDEFVAAVERIPRYDRVRQVGERDGTHLFELGATDPPIAGSVATHGGRVKRVAVEGDELRVVAELPHTTSVRRVVDALGEELPDVTVASQRTASRRPEAVAATDAVLDELTDRQREVFEAAYYGGYFDWPRGSTAEDLAASLSISSPTFHQHLRRALRKLLATFVEE